MSALETSVTLEDVFQVVNSRRVPLAAELAGYLALEIAEGATAGQGDIDPRSVFIGEEGSVAQVKPKRETGAAAPAGDTETSVRGILAALLEASGSKTPALGNVAKARPGEGLRKLVEQLETALIPVNRAAGRRALARLAREVKRVTQGVGRNAPAARPPREMGDDSPRSSRESPSAPHAPAASEARKVAPVRDDIADLLDNRTSERAPVANASEPVAEHLPEPSGPRHSILK